MIIPEIRSPADLSHLNTFGITASCNHLVELRTIEEAKALLSSPTWKDTPKLILGGGSNVLFTRNFEGLVILDRIGGITISNESENHVNVTAGGGVVWHDLVTYAVNRNLGGLENLSLIPGTVGASPIQNIGAYGVEVKDCFESLTAVSVEDGSVRTFSKADCQFGYRDSIFKHSAKGKFLIADVTFLLTKHPILNTSYGAIEQELSKSDIEHPSIKDVSEAVIRIRSAKLPDPSRIGNAGSFFKNPEVPMDLYLQLKNSHPSIVAYQGSKEKMKLAAGWLIEQCGWKGRQEGRVGMHRDQALVLVNYGGATGEELISHARRVQLSVKERFGVELEMEVNVI